MVPQYGCHALVEGKWEGTIARYADPGPSVGTMDKLTSDKRYLSNAWHLSGALRFIAVPSL